ncbi:MAG TPA: hypothetical protein VGU68_12945 [Ktedonobacteraceae bacterium]|nr:hypothetical protein [Ktedonobacteraceae bacterium]
MTVILHARHSPSFLVVARHQIASHQSPILVHHHPLKWPRCRTEQQDYQVMYKTYPNQALQCANAGVERREGS